MQGLDLSVYREGRELRHPKTGELLGKTEQALGRVVLSQIFEGYSLGTVIQGGGILPGDKVRVSSGKIPLTLLALSDGVKAPLTEAVVHELIEELSRTGRFQISQGDQVAVFLAQDGVKAPEALQGNKLRTAIERFKIEQLLVVYLSRAQNKPYMEIRLFSHSRSDPLLATALFVPPSIKPPPQGGFSASTRERGHSRPKEQRSLLARLLGGELEPGTYSSGESSIPLREAAKLNIAVVSMDVAVSPKDQTPRVAVTDGIQIHLYRLVNGDLQREWVSSPPGFGRIISLQLADLDGDGLLEVVANRYHAQTGPTSFILTTKAGKPTVLVKDIGDFLLAVDQDGDGVKETLWVQRFNPEAAFTPGQADRVSVRNGALVKEGTVRVPDSFRATGATLSNITGKGSRALAYVDEHQRLRIALEGEEIWRSSTALGGGAPVIEILRPISQGAMQSYFYKMEPIPLAVDLDGDGIEEIVIPQNQFPGFLAVVFRGPAGYRIQSINSGFEGAITGFGAIPGQDSPTLIASVVRFKNVLRIGGETQILMTVPQE
jgi:hypothetical protein